MLQNLYLSILFSLHNWYFEIMIMSSIPPYEKAVFPATVASFRVHFVFCIDFSRCANLLPGWNPSYSLFTYLCMSELILRAAGCEGKARLITFVCQWERRTASSMLSHAWLFLTHTQSRDCKCLLRKSGREAAIWLVGDIYLKKAH